MPRGKDDGCVGEEIVKGNWNLVESKKRSLNPATFFLMTGLLLGILYSVIVPYGAGFDEERHMVRVYRMSYYLFLPNFRVNASIAARIWGPSSCSRCVAFDRAGALTRVRSRCTTRPAPLVGARLECVVRRFGVARCSTVRRDSCSPRPRWVG